MILSNKKIQMRIREIGRKSGLRSDNAICRKCGFNDATMIGKIGKLKTSPQLDTLDKFARGLNCTVVDLIYNRGEVDMDLSLQISQMTEYQKLQMVVFAKMLLNGIK